MSFPKVYLALFASFITLAFVFFIGPRPTQAVACTGSCAVYGCDAGLTCRSSSLTCGKLYNQCVGLTCYGNQANGGWDFSSPCDQGNLCNNAGTTRTAGSWSTWSTCTGTCGLTGGTQTRTCNCGSENNCPTTCSGGAACGSTPSQACCVGAAPQAPTGLSVSPICTTNGQTTINWTFGTGGCGGAWGLACSGASNTFSIMDGASTIASGIPAGTNPYSRAITLSAGAHSLRVCASNGATSTCSTTPYAMTMTYDTTAPGVPSGGAVSFAIDPACVDKYIPTYSWNTVTDTGCAGLNATSYHPQASSNVGFSTLLFGWSDSWINTTNKAAATSYGPGTSLYFRVQSRDAFNNTSAMSSTLTQVVPTPSPYPTIAMTISGSFTEEVGGSCYSGMTYNASSLTFAPVVNPSVGTTVSCSKTNTTYSCDISIDNTQGQCISPNVTLTLNASYPGYSSVGWRTGESCAGTAKDWDLTVGDNKVNIPLFFKYNGGTGSGTGGWFKLSQASYNSRMSGRTNYIPNTISAYDSDDTTANRYMIIGTDGSIAQNNPVVVGPANTAYSQNNWYTNGYTHTSDVSYLQYIDYIKARKDVISITSPDLSQINSDGIYTISAPVVLDETRFDGKKVVLVVQGASATFNTNFVPVNGSVAILAKDIIIDPSVTEINGILIGQTVTMGASANGLKIKGNLVDEEAMQIERAQADARKPSLFVVFDMATYLNILPYLSTSTYDWKQLQ